MDPSLGVHDVADGVVSAAHRISQGDQFLLQRLDPSRIVEQKLEIVAAGEAQIAARVFVRQVGKDAQRVDAQQARCARAHRVDAVARFRDMTIDAGGQIFVVFPLAVVFLDQGMEILFVMRRPDVGESRLGCGAHFSPSFAA